MHVQKIILFCLSVVLLLALTAVGWGADFYVDSTVAVNGNGTIGSPWKLLSNVNWSNVSGGGGLASGPTNINLKRGSVWNESFYVNRTDGTTNLLTIQAYGTGAPPTITGITSTTSGGWTQVGGSGNVWQYFINTSYIDACAFGGTYSNGGATFYGGLWGQPMGSLAQLVGNYQFFSGSNDTIYVYSADAGGNPVNPVIRYGGIYPVNVGGRGGGYLLSTYRNNYIRFTGIRAVNFSSSGLICGPSSDHIQIDYCQFDGATMGGAYNFGIYLMNTNATDIKIFNTDLLRCLYGAYAVNPAAGGHVFRNDRFVGCLTAGLYGDGTNNNVDYCYVYANGAYLNDFLYDGTLTWGTHNLGSLQGLGSRWTNTGKPNWKIPNPYPPKVAIVIDDVDSQGVGTDASTDTDVAAVNDELQAFSSRGVKCGLAVKAQAVDHMANFPAQLLSWFNAGHSIISHSYSHNFWSLPAILSIRYLVAESCTMTISGNTLTTSCATPANNLSIDLTAIPGDAYSTVDGLATYITNFGGGRKYTAAVITDNSAPPSTKYTHAKTLADVTAVNVSTGAYKCCTDKSRLVQDEMTTSKSVIEGVIGSGNCRSYVFPGTITDAVTEGYANSAGYLACRGVEYGQAGEAIAATVSAGGSGYAVGDYLTLSTVGTWSLFRVATLSGSAVATVTIPYKGAGCPSGVNNTVTLSGGGSGCTLNLSTASQPGGTMPLPSSGVDRMNLQGNFAMNTCSGQSTAWLKGLGASVMYKSMLWGQPYVLWHHPTQLTQTEMGAILDGILSVGGLTQLDEMGTYLAGLTPMDAATTVASGTVRVPDWGLFSGDACIDAGMNVGLTQDIQGNPIIGMPDIGAFEFQGSTNTSPVVTITSPASGSTFSNGSSINFSGTAIDAQNGDLSSILAWTSNIDGNLGTGGGFSRVLSPGTHTITASVTDPGGLTGTATITLTVQNNTAPVVTINGPANGSTVPAGTAIVFSGTAIDAESGDLTGSLTWTSSIDGPIGSGGSFSKTLSSGTHTITASVTDPGGLTGSKTISITVSGNTAPVVTITNPANGATFASGAVISFSGTATDTESGNLTSGLTWTSSIDGPIGSGGSFSKTLSSGTHTITASVTDPGGSTGSKTISITVSGNTAPVVTITNPANGATFASGAVISFSGTATDTESGNLTSGLTWTSSIDGPIGSGGSFSKTLSSGTHTITASVTDPGGSTGSKTISITVSQPNTAPVVTITNPANGATFASGAVISFSGTATDTESGNLTSGLTWTSSIDGPIGSGGSFSKTLSSGTHTITASVTDPGGLTGSKTISITVQSPSGDPTLVDSFYMTPGSDYAPILAAGITALAQSFTSNTNAYQITRVDWSLLRIGNPTGNLVAKLYDLSGNWGSTGVPGTLRATSNPIAASSVNNSVYTLTTFTFSTPWTTTANQHYIISIEADGTGDDNNYIQANQNTYNAFAGNDSYYIPTTWTSEASNNICFYVYGIVK